MKFEKITDDKIKVFFDKSDLKNNNISFHSFMANSLEKQDIFIQILSRADKELGFCTNDCKIIIEALTEYKDSFTLILCKYKENLKSNITKLHTNRKIFKPLSNVSIYKFSNFDDFFTFSSYINCYYPDIVNILQNFNSLYKINNDLYLFIYNISADKKMLFKLTSIFSEFCTLINLKNNFHSEKMLENSEVLIKDNALQTFIDIQKKKY